MPLGWQKYKKILSHIFWPNTISKEIKTIALLQRLKIYSFPEKMCTGPLGHSQKANRTFLELYY